jgi:cytochrome c oxidase subunit 4
MRGQEKTLVLVWLALLLLLAASAASALLRLGPWNSVLNLAIAAVKAALVLLFFMRLRASHALVRLAALAGIATLAILFGLAGSDYATRTLYPAPLQAPRQLAPLALP